MRSSFYLFEVIRDTLASAMAATLLTVVLLMATFTSPKGGAQMTEQAFATITVVCLAVYIAIDVYIHVYARVIPGMMSSEGISVLDALGVGLRNTRVGGKCIIVPPKGGFLGSCDKSGWRYVICDSQGNIGAVIVKINKVYQAITCANLVHRTALVNKIDLYLSIASDSPLLPSELDSCDYCLWVIDLRRQIANELANDLLIQVCTDLLLDRFAPTEDLYD